MSDKEAKARIKINRLLEESGWRFFDDENGYANIRLEPNVKIKQSDIDAMGDDFEKTKNGFVDYLLLDERGNPLIVLEAKKADINPLYAKLQVMKDFKRIHEQKNVDAAMTELVRFCEKYGKIYPKLVERLSDVTSFFSFYDFPESIRPSIYTTNLIENFNKQIKSQCKKKVQFPNEASLERFICGIVLEYNRESEERIHKGFALAQAQLTDLFI